MNEWMSGCPGRLRERLDHFGVETERTERRASARAKQALTAGTGMKEMGRSANGRERDRMSWSETYGM